MGSTELDPIAPGTPPPITASAAPVPARQTDRRRWVILTAVALVCLGLGWLLRVSEPRGQAFFPKCQFHQVTGMQCAGCGSTRAVHHLLNGRVVDALRSNAMLVGFMPVAAVVFVGGFRRWWRGGEFLPFIGGRFVWWTVGVLVAFSVVRNIPVRPFIYLSPPVVVSSATSPNP